MDTTSVHAQAQNKNRVALLAELAQCMFCSNQRLGQFLDNALFAAGKDHSDLYYLSEEDMLEVLAAYRKDVESGNPNSRSRSRQGARSRFRS